jgi:hypothetical protein
MLSPKQKIALIVGAAAYAVQSWAGYTVYKNNVELRKANDETIDFANRAAYLVMFLSIKCAENGVEFDEFDERVMSDPPKLIDPDNPNLFGEFFERYEEAEMDTETIHKFIESLQVLRASDET